MKKSLLKIALIGPPTKRVNKNSIGGVEIFTHYLFTGLQWRGHKVKLFSDILHHFIDEEKWQKVSSVRRIHLGACCHSLEFCDFLEHQKDFDLVVISVYNFYFFLPLFQFLKIPHLIIIHGPCLGSDLFKKFVLKKYRLLNLINVSKFMAENFTKGYKNVVIYNGIDISEFDLSIKSGKRFLWLSRIVKNKGLKEAIQIAKKAKICLDIFGPISDQEYFNKEIKPFLNGKIKYCGAADHRTKNKFYGRAKALLAPIKWEEPFGLVFIEAMACGTPVIAFRKGAVPEVIVDGKTGFICPPGDEKAMIKAVKKIVSMPGKEYQKMRKNCRDHVEKHFSSERMIDDYEKIMEKIILDWRKKKK